MTQKVRQMIFEWDKNKAARNLKKHGVTFDDATTVFGDPLALSFPDLENSDEEERFLTFGQTSGGIFVLISHTDRENSIRIISAREMTSSERSGYERY